MSIPMTGLPADQRPRERLCGLGAQALTDAELLAVLLRNGTAGASAIDVAVELLAEAGGLHRLAEARPEELARRKGIGVAKATTLVAAFHLAARSRSPNEPDVPLDEPGAIAAAARPAFVGVRTERLVVLVCDARNRLRRRVPVAEGGIDKVPLPLREIMNVVLRSDGRGFALAHNHPSGDPEPSWQDRRSTEVLLTATRTVDLRFLDHIVVAGEEWASALTGAHSGEGGSGLLDPEAA